VGSSLAEDRAEDRTSQVVSEGGAPASRHGASPDVALPWPSSGCRLRSRAPGRQGRASPAVAHRALRPWARPAAYRSPRLVGRGRGGRTRPESGPSPRRPGEPGGVGDRHQTEQGRHVQDPPRPRRCHRAQGPVTVSVPIVADIPATVATHADAPSGPPVAVSSAPAGTCTT
jgi:hypothetical protein